jgi:hypothetical protein
MIDDDDSVHPRSSEPAEGGAGTPPPERGSPTPPDAESEKGGDDEQAEPKPVSNQNPLAPPVNIEPES